MRGVWLKFTGPHTHHTIFNIKRAQKHNSLPAVPHGAKEAAERRRAPAHEAGVLLAHPARLLLRGHAGVVAAALFLVVVLWCGLVLGE